MRREVQCSRGRAQGPHAGTVAQDAQSDDYRTADPRDVVEDNGAVMAAPAGAPQEETSPEERRSRDRS
jgi:hypothetical protein